MDEQEWSYSRRHFDVTCLATCEHISQQTPLGFSQQFVITSFYKNYVLVVLKISLLAKLKLYIRGWELLTIMDYNYLQLCLARHGNMYSCFSY